jgi:polyisoprenoid-binding protein YceI
MKKSLWIALSALLWTAGLQAQATPAAPTAKQPAALPGAATATKPASPAATAAPGSTIGKPAPAAQAAAVVTPGTSPAAASPAANPNDKSVEWTLDASHSQISFVARHLGFSKATGHFKKFAAVVRADPKTGKISALEATAETASIDTGIEKRDAHLRSDDFLNADKFPQLKLVAKSIKWNGNKFTAQADLTIRDVTKSVPFKGELLGVHNVNFGQGLTTRAGYEATATINRKDFGLKWNMVTEGLSVVADPIQIELAVEIGYTPPAAGSAAATPAPTAAPTASTAKPTAPVAPTVKAPAAPTAPVAPKVAAPSAPSAPTATK